MFGGSKIAHKLALVNALSAVIVLAISGFFLLYTNMNQLQEVFEKRIQLESNLLASTMNAAILFEDWETAQELLHSLLTDDAVHHAYLTDAGGIVRAQVWKDGAEATEPPRVLSAQKTVVDSKNQHLASVRILDSGLVIGQLHVIGSNVEVSESVEQAIKTMMLLTLCALCIGLLLTVRLQSILLSPIEALRKLARRVRSDEDYTIRGEVKNHDEVGQLTVDFNAMLDIIQTRDAVLADKIASRTSELEQKNTELHSEIRQRKDSETALQESQVRFENAFTNAPIGMALIGNSGEFMQRNRVLNELLDLEESTAFTLVDILTPEQASDVFRQLDQLINNNVRSFDIQATCNTQLGRSLTCILSISGIHDAQGTLQYSVLQLQDITESVRLSKELSYQATHDALTDLANRRVFEKELAEANSQVADEGYEFSLCLMDLDQFKIVNDTCGHTAGDVLLRQVAATIKNSVRPDDLVVRLGGDEFAVLLYKCGSTDAIKIAESIRKAIEVATFYWEGSNFRVGVSIGLLTVKDSKQNITDILKQADAACFAAKDLGRNRVYQVEVDDQGLARSQGEMHWVGRINRALENQEFILYTQPIVSICAPSGESKRCEVLIRLRDFDEHRLIPPGAFLPSAERYDLSSRLDRWVVTTLLKTLRSYVDLFGENRKFWVNLSGHSVGDDQFLAELDASLADANLPKGMINFEVTETAIIRNVDKAVAAMHRLKAYGCSFALDDFGSGLSSFGYLKNLPVDYIKIDGMFVRNILIDEVDRMFVKSIIDIAKVMSIGVVAEFVENDDIRNMLESLGADYGQGFGLGRPVQLLPDHVDISALKMAVD